METINIYLSENDILTLQDEIKKLKDHDLSKNIFEFSHITNKGKQLIIKINVEPNKNYK